MSLEEWLVVGNVLDARQRLALVELGHPVDQQKWIAMGQVIQYLVDIHSPACTRFSV
jgi:hypothetical protein